MKLRKLSTIRLVPSLYLAVMSRAPAAAGLIPRSLSFSAIPSTKLLMSKSSSEDDNAGWDIWLLLVVGMIWILWRTPKQEKTGLVGVEKKSIEIYYSKFFENCYLKRLRRHMIIFWCLATKDSTCKSLRTFVSSRRRQFRHTIVYVKFPKEKKKREEPVQDSREMSHE